MKHFLLSCLLIAVSQISRGQDIGQIIAETNLDSLVKTVRVLTGEDSTYVNGTKILIKTRSNYYSEDGNASASDYIKGRLLKYDLKVEDQVFDYTGRNILATQTGTGNPDSIYIICAHYDAVDFYCADDDASGVSAVIEAARILSDHCFDYTILYALWDNEEDGLIGSDYYAQIAYSEGYTIAGVLNVEMIGYDSNSDMKFEINTNNIPASLAVKDELLSTINNYSLSLIPVVVNPGNPMSDHSSFWNYDFGAVVFSELFFEGDGNPYYHSEEDRISKFNLQYFKELTKLGVGTIASLANLKPSCQTVTKTLSVAPGNQNAGPAAGSTSFTITSNTNWTVSDDAAWLTITSSGGSNNGTITAGYDANTSTSSRVATVTVSGSGVNSQIVTVTQEGAKTLTVSPGNQNTGPSAGSTSFTITSNTTWTVTDDAAWLTINTSGGSNNGTITAVYDATTSTSSRVATVTVSGSGVNSQIVTVTQEGVQLYLNTSLTSLSVSSEEGASGTFNIVSNTNWTTSSSETWLILSSNNGTGDATITVTVQNNPTANSRNSVVTVRATGVSDKTVTVTQAGSPTGIDETENDRIKIYPNPAKDHLIIKTDNYSDMPDYSIRIVSLPGTIVFETKVTEPFYQLNLSELPGKGIYILQVFDNKSATKTLRKIIIQ